MTGAHRPVYNGCALHKGDADMPDLEKLLDTEIGGFSLGNLLAAIVIFLVSLIIIKLLMKAIKKALA